MFANWEFVREWPTRKIGGFGLPLGCGDQSYLIFDWSLRQITFNIRSTELTRAVHGGIALGPARAWLAVKSDNFNAGNSSYSCLHMHIIFPGATWPWVPFWRTRFPFGRLSVFASHAHNRVS